MDTAVMLVGTGRQERKVCSEGSSLETDVLQRRGPIYLVVFARLPWSEPPSTYSGRSLNLDRQLAAFVRKAARLESPTLLSFNLVLIN